MNRNAVDGCAQVQEPFREHHISAGDAIRLYVRDYGAASEQEKVILCLGGVTRNSKDFHELASRLMPDYRVICPDYRGRGRSAYDPDWRHYNPRVYLDDIHHIACALDLQHFAVIGTSLGGVLAMAMGASMPGRLRGVLLNDIGPDIPTDGMAPILEYMRNDIAMPDWPSVVQRLQSTFPNMPAYNEADWLRIAHATYRERDDGELVFDWDPDIVRAFERKVDAGVDLWPLFRSLRRLPVLSVRGALSPFVNEQTRQAMAHQIPDLRQVCVEGVGHVPSLNEPDCAGAIKGWLSASFAA